MMNGIAAKVVKTFGLSSIPFAPAFPPGKRLDETCAETLDEFRYLPQKIIHANQISHDGTTVFSHVERNRARQLLR